MMNLRFLFFGLFISAAPALEAAEYYTSLRGSDANNGQSRETAFRTIQRGVDALKPGDRLTIAPGEYHESVRRKGIGGSEAETVIRAEIPGTVHLRGDKALQGFTKVEGTRFVYATKFDPALQVQAVNEVDTLKVLEVKPNRTELEFKPGTYFQDRKAGILYVASTDHEDVGAHHYTVSVIGTHGIYLSQPQRVVIEGLTVSGFNAASDAPKADRTFDGTWGIFLLEGKQCVVRGCRVYLNGHGIGSYSRADALEETGDNVIEHCMAWANASQFAGGDTGGITLYSPRRDRVRHCASFLNRKYGINIYLGGASGEKEENKSILSDNLAWGNACDFKIKTGMPYVHEMERCVGLGLWSVRQPERVRRSLIGPDTSRDYASDNIHWSPEDGLNLEDEFADPENLDFRLQATSRFRGTDPDRSDSGPFPYEKNIYYVSPGGDDTKDGLSVKGAWKTLARASGALKAGDTFYLLPGVYEEGLELRVKNPVTIRGRGTKPAVIRGAVKVGESEGLCFERVSFEGEVVAGKARFLHCNFSGASKGLQMESARELPVTNWTFNSFRNLLEVSHFRDRNVPLRLVVPPEVHSVSASTANIEWVTSQTAATGIAWGETPECERRLEFSSGNFATFSLAGLEPGKTYYFRIESLRSPISTWDILKGEVARDGKIPVQSALISFTTKTVKVPVEYFVSPDGNDTGTGRTLKDAWRTVQRAADEANAGDTVSIAPGRYSETVRIRATGDKEAPVTFRALPGGKVIMDGDGGALSQGFVVFGKSHLNFDGFTFSNYNLLPSQGAPWPELSAEFALGQGKAIQITRCFSDGRGGYTAPFVRAMQVGGLLIKNSVFAAKMSSGVHITRCPEVRIENCVSARSLTAALVVDNTMEQPIILEKNIITDMLKKKADMNGDLIPFQEGKALHLADNAFFLRSFPVETRQVFSRTDHVMRTSEEMTLGEFERRFGITKSVIGDPIFAGSKRLTEKEVSKLAGFYMDALMDPNRELSIEDFFATNPEFVERGIGLQPSAFENRPTLKE